MQITAVNAGDMVTVIISYADDPIVYELGGVMRFWGLVII